ncbi:hypothetical protein [Nocardia sp. SSK8]|uniref:hypothetical protein n=1 Tax=Nocardia sp. SSK8 TaxID=3120154 RepID=UPI00300A34C1
MAASAVSLAVPAPHGVADPGVPTIDQIISGSAAPGTAAAPGDGQSAGLELGLGTGSAGTPGRAAVPSGSSAGNVPNPAAGQSLGLGPDTPPGIDAPGAIASDPAPEPASIAVPGTLGGLLFPDTDLLLPACVGSAAVGSAALGSGIVTGSGFGSSLIGVGSSGIIGSGSAGAGSVAVGSAAAGSAALTCLLLLPVPSLPELGIPLNIPPTAAEPVAVPAPGPLPEVIPTIPAEIPPLPPPPVATAAPVQSPPAPPLTALQVMTVLIVTVIAGARARLRGRR